MDDFPDDHELPQVPTQLWLLLTLEVVISDAHGESLLLIYPYYSLDGLEDAGTMLEGYWTPPFFGYPVDLGFRVPDTVGAVKALFQAYEGQIDSVKEIGELAYVMGFLNPNIVSRGNFIELKKSPRSPDLWKCYKILRFSYSNLVPRGRRNLADPECRKGYAFLPLGDLDNVLKDRYSLKHDRIEHLFLSKPLVSNLDYIIQSPQHLATLRTGAISLKSNDFQLDEKGLVACADLAGYGAACKYALEKMHSFTESGKTIATSFRESVACLFYRFLATVGVSQVHTAGDGFIAAIPQRHFIDGDAVSTVRAFIYAYRAMLSEIEQFNSAIADQTKRIGSRLALHYGNYRYGRIALSRSVSADFDGASIIEVARLEGALREYIKGPIQRSTVKDTGKKRNKNDTQSLSHAMICSETLLEIVGSMFDDNMGLSFRTEIPIRIKEYESSGHVFYVDVLMGKEPSPSERATT